MSFFAIAYNALVEKLHTINPPFFLKREALKLSLFCEDSNGQFDCAQFESDHDYLVIEILPSRV